MKIVFFSLFCVHGILLVKRMLVSNISTPFFLVDLLKFPGDVCFSSGVLGPDGTNRYLGKWCKRGQMKGSNIGDLITVGADGRGGTVKVLRSSNQSAMVGSKIHFPVQLL